MRLADADASEAVGRALAPLLSAGDVIALTGPLGAGKTSIARGLLAGLGLTTEAPSPSFAIVQPYAPPEVRMPVLHIDLYRLNDPEEVWELGLDDARHDHALLVEWPDRAGVGAWPGALGLSLAVMPDGARCLTASVPTGWRQRWPFP